MSKTLHQTVDKIIIEKTGKLEIFIDAITIEVLPHEDFEAWHISSEDGVLIICLPSGELAIWT